MILHCRGVSASDSARMGRYIGREVSVVVFVVSIHTYLREEPVMPAKDACLRNGDPFCEKQILCRSASGGTDTVLEIHKPFGTYLGPR